MSEFNYTGLDEEDEEDDVINMTSVYEAKDTKSRYNLTITDKHTEKQNSK